MKTNLYIEQAFKAKTAWWRYVIGMMVVLLAWQILGGIPLMAALFIEMWPEIGAVSGREGLMEILQVLDPNLMFFLLLFMFAVGLAALLMVIRFIHDQPLIEATTSRKKIDWGRVSFGFAVVTVFTVVVTLVEYYRNPEDFLWNFKLVPFLTLALIAVVMVPLQTSFEEYLFRGYLMQGLGVLARNRWFPLLFTSVLFGSLHLWNPEVAQLGNIIMVYYIGTGLLLGIMTLMDEGLELALGFHFGNNLTGALLITADWTAFQTHSVFKDISDPTAGLLEVVLPVLVVYPLFLYIMSRMYNWTDWKGKLFGKVVPPTAIKSSDDI